MYEIKCLSWNLMESSDKHIVQVEVHLKKGLPKTLSLLIDKWNHT